MTDGERYVQVDLSLPTPIISQWIGPYRTVKATFNSETYYAPLIQKLGARLVLAGIDPVANNWFLSSINDPFDWTPTFGTGSETKALAGSQGTKFGQVGENIKALIPVGPDSIVFAGTTSMTMLSGDPAFTNVQFRQISRSVGVLGKRAFTPINEMATLVCSTEGVFAIDPNSFDIERGARITRDRLDSLFSSIDFENVGVCMGYDESRSTALLCLTRTDDASASRIYALDINTGSWWPWKISNVDMRGIRAVTPFRPIEGTRTVPIFGTDQGHLLAQPENVVLHQDGGVLANTSFSSTHSPSADAVDFDSEVLFGPVNSDPSRRVLLKDVRVILGARTEGEADTPASGPFMSILHGDTAQEAVGFGSDITVTETLTIVDANAASGTNFDGGDESASPTYTATLWGGLGKPIAGTYTPNATNTLLIDTTFSGPGSWTFSRNSDGKWEFKDSGVVYYQTTNAISGLPETVPIRTGTGDTDSFVPTTDQASLASTGFGSGTETSTIQLARGRSSAKRQRIRTSDFFVKIGANSRAWALEDVSVDVEDGGPVRSVS
jgi:hypothetical protein